MRPERLRIEVAWTVAGRAHVLAFEVPAGATVRNVVDQAGLLHGVPLPPHDTRRYAVFGTLCAAHTLVREGDRIEILRVLPHDPKAVRRRRAEEQRAGRRRAQR